MGSLARPARGSDCRELGDYPLAGGVPVVGIMWIGRIILSRGVKRFGRVVRAQFQALGKVFDFDTMCSILIQFWRSGGTVGETMLVVAS